MKKPTNKKPAIVKKEQEFDFSDFTQDTTKVPADIARMLEEKGLIGRWVNLGTMKRYGGRHPKGWEPFKIERSDDEIALFGSGADGYFQRGDLVLAAKPKQEVAKHKAYLKHEAKMHSVKEKMRRDKRQFKDDIRQQGLDDSIKVVDGYDE